MAIMDYIPQWGQALGTQDVSGAPIDDSMAQFQLKRKLAQAEALRNMQMPEGQMVSGHYVAPSWTQYLAGLSNKIQAGANERQAMKEYGEFQKGRQAKIADLLAGKEVQQPVDLPSAIPGQTQTVRQPYSQEEFMSKAAGIMPELQDELLKARIAQFTKDRTPIKGSAGDVFFDPITHKEVFTVPGKPQAILSNVQADPITGKFYGYNKDTNQMVEVPGQAVTPKPPEPKAPAMRTRDVGTTQIQEVMVGAPTKENPQGTWEKVAEAPRFAPEKLKEIPPTQRNAYAGNKASISQIDAAIQAVENAPDEYFGLKGGMGNTYMSRLYPGSVDVRQKVTGVGAAKRHELSGSAVTPSENLETAPLLPRPTDDKQTVLTKLRGLKQNYEATNQAILGSFGSEYAPMPSATAPQAPVENKPKPTLKYNPQTRKLEPM